MNDRQFGQGEIRQLNLRRLPIRTITSIAIALLVAITVLTTVYTVGPEETGVVLRFGKFVRTEDPGLHFRLPLGIEKVSKVPIQRQMKEEFGFETVRAGVRSQYSTGGRQGESNMLTGDLNAAVVEWVVQYRIVEPRLFLFHVRNVQDTFRDLSEAVMRRVVGDRTVNEVLTVGRQEVADLVEQELQVLCENYEMGVKVEQVVLQDVNPPDPVKPSFNEVNEAQQEREKLINEAQSEYNKVIPRAKGEAEQVIAQAEGYQLKRVNRAQGEASRFNALYAAYTLAPEVTRKRLYLEAMASVLPRVENKIILNGDMKGVLPLLNLGGVNIGNEGGK
ncbi:MAG TPA: FtsH protease activity modulator HflK [Candidatus Krumholzibacteria bacterium]|jgi:membrane protease subunit HflK